MRRAALFAFSLALIVLPALAKAEDGVKRITPRELQDRLDQGEDVLIIDVRSDGAYESSGLRVKGDIRISPGILKDRKDDLPRDRDIVFYCT